jgi:hypothetical protein
MKNYLLLTLIIFTISLANAQLTHYSTSNSGLISNQVTSISIDNSGNKWIGTIDSGVSKFDGNTWTTFNHSNSGLSSDSINSIAVDLQGNIWFGTFGQGVSKYNGSSWTTYTTSNGLADNFIRSLFIDSQNNKWFGTIKGITKFDNTNWITYNQSNSTLACDTIFSITEDHNGNIWVGAGMIDVSKFNYTSWTNYNVGSYLWSNAYCITVDTNNNIWVGKDEGILKYDNNNWNVIYSPHNIHAINVDKNNNIWAGNYSDAYYYNGSTWTSANIGYSVTTIAVDSINNKWIGGQGVTFYSQCGIPPLENICYVEFDPLTIKNNINWTQNLPSNVDSIRIYNEVSTNVWNLIGAVSSGQNHFTDMNSSPLNQSYSYKISSVDTCGNESALSTAQTTITLLAAYDIGTNTYGFTWSPYQGLSVSNYYLYGVNISGTETILGSVPGNQYFYNITNPFPGFIKYFVGFSTPTCDSKTNHLVKSNYVSSINAISDLTNAENSLKFYPNPVTDILKIDSDLKIDKIEISDITGRILLNSEVNKIDCSNLANGVYYITITTSKGFFIKKFIKK